ncbi:hypothetical protein TOK_5046 [Pseudonocardia sp. N23]|nr:hypothetical protein TOK_5046 [Pseudonocardia sp. N23]
MSRGLRGMSVAGVRVRASNRRHRRRPAPAPRRASPCTPIPAVRS